MLLARPIITNLSTLNTTITSGIPTQILVSKNDIQLITDRYVFTPSLQMQATRNEQGKQCR